MPSVHESSSRTRAPLPVKDTSSAYRTWAVANALLFAAFAVPLYRWLRFGLHDEAQSHVLLVPVVSAYLAWTRRKEAPRAQAAPAASVLPLLVGAGLLTWYFAFADRAHLAAPDALAYTIAALVCGFVAVTLGCLGPQLGRFAAFPLGFLVFMIPMPTALTAAAEAALQQGSATAAHAMFTLARMPLVRYDLVFRLPGITIEIAPECSGIRSTLALFITSIVAGHLFLRSPWRRIVLAAAVIPLALLRNGFRVFTIGELCVHVSPDMIDSYIHHHGGPIFFALSLIPFGLLLWWLARTESPLRRAPVPTA